MIPELHGKAYEQRLIAVKLTTLETRRLRGNLIEMFKILKGFDKTSLSIATNNLSNRRGHSLKLFNPFIPELKIAIRFISSILDFNYYVFGRD